MTITFHRDLVQGSDEWHAARCGLITASEIKLLLSPKTLKPLNNEKTRAHVWELAAQRISDFVEPTYIGDDMLRGHEDEIRARDLYAMHFAPVEECGFVTNDSLGFVLGCSPDGLVGDDGALECKSRRQKFQVQTVVEYHREGVIPEEHVLQVQAVMLITGRSWLDFISYSGGLPMSVMRVREDEAVQQAIITAAVEAERQIEAAIADFDAATRAGGRFIATERTIEQQMFV